jgi:hypothetical protein
MTNPGKRRAPHSGTADEAPPKQTSSAPARSSTPTAQAGAAPRAGILSIQALLNSSRPTPSLPNQSQLSLHAGRDASPQQERAVQFEPAQRPEPQHDAAAGPALGQFFSQPSQLSAFQPAGGADAASATSSRGPRQQAVGKSGLSTAMRPDEGTSSQLSKHTVPQTRTPVDNQPMGGPETPQALVGVQRSGGADSRSEPLNVLTSLEADPRLSMQFYPGFSSLQSVVFDPRMYPQSSNATSSLPSQTDEGRKHLDYYRFCLLRDYFTYLHIAKHGKQELKKPREAVNTTSAAILSPAVARLTFFVNDATERAAKLRKEFKSSYSPAIRDLNILTYFYSPEVWRVFEECRDPRKRLVTIEAKLQTLVRKVIQTDAELDLYCEYVLVIEEESRELLAATAFPATHSQSTQTRQEPPVRDTAQARSDETDVIHGRGGFRGGYPSRVSTSHARGGSSTHVDPARYSFSGTGGTQDDRSASASVTPSMQGGGSSQVSLKAGHAPHSSTPRASIDSPIKAVTPYSLDALSLLTSAALTSAAQGGSSGTSGTSGLNPAASSSAAQGDSSETGRLDLATLSSTESSTGKRARTLAASASTAQGDSSETGRLDPAALSSTGPSTGKRARTLAASASAAQGGSIATSGLNPAASSSAAQGGSSGTGRLDPATLSSTAQDGSSGASRLDIAALASTGPWTGIRARTRAASPATAQGPLGGQRGGIQAASSSLAQGSSGGKSGRTLAASPSTAQGSSTRTRAHTPAASHSIAQGPLGGQRGGIQAASSSPAQGSSSRTRNRPPATSSAASQASAAWEASARAAVVTARNALASARSSSAASQASTPWMAAALGALANTESSASPAPAARANTPDPPR